MPTEAELAPWLPVEQEIAALLPRIDPAQFRALLDSLRGRAPRCFVSGQGRSGLIGQMLAMRLMQLGYTTHVVGEVTAPAVGPGDRFILICGSGRTPVSLGFAATAKAAGARLIVITHKPESELAGGADICLAIPASATAQFGNTLFEQVCLILFDSICLELGRDVAEQAMWGRHTNMQ